MKTWMVKVDEGEEDVTARPPENTRVSARVAGVAVNWIPAG